MKGITFPKDYKKYMTISEVEAAKAMIAEQREEEETTAGWAEYAVREALKDTGDYLDRILEAKAEISGNSRVWNAYNLDSGKLDIWIEATARTGNGFIIVGAYLTDIWQSGAVDYKGQMWIRYFQEEK